MSDRFALLGLPRRPWLDPKKVRSTFQELSSKKHPDKLGLPPGEESEAAQREYAAINEAARCLENPKERLRHLLTLERGRAPMDIQEIPSELAEFMIEVGEVAREADRLLAEKQTIVSPLLRVEWFGRAQPCQNRLSGLQERLQAWVAKLDEQLLRLDSQWGAELNKSTVLPALEELFRLYGYAQRWNNQLQERAVRFLI